MSVAKFVAEVIRQRDAICTLLGPNSSQPMDLVIREGDFFSKLDNCQRAAHRQAETRDLAAYLCPMIDEAAEAHQSLLADAIEIWDHHEDVDAGLTPRRRRFTIRPTIFFRQSKAIAKLLPYVVKGTKHRKKRATRRRRSTTDKPRKLTPWQIEVIEIVGDCKGNAAAAGRKLNRDASTIREVFKAGMKKLGKDTLYFKKSGRLITRDQRGQLDVADIDDARREEADETQRRKYRRRD